jgi:transketolase
MLFNHQSSIVRHQSLEENVKMFEKEALTQEEVAELAELSRLAKGDIITMTHLAGTGHPGGSMSSLDLYLVLFSNAVPDGEGRDRVVVSHGHTSPGAYSALARLGYLPTDEVIGFFRKVGSPFEGHVVKGMPFIDWSTGNLGQGLSVGCGFALASRMRKEDSHVWVLMGDGEQQKGQIGEARRFAKKYNLSNITAIVDYNGLQISGAIDCVMPQNIVENFLADGWDVLEINGHDYYEIFAAMKKAREATNPVCIVAKTVMGNGVSFMEHKEKYHGSPLNAGEYKEAMAILGLEDRLDFYKDLRKGRSTWTSSNSDPIVKVDGGTPRTYHDEDKIDNRTAFGNALKDLADRNIPKGQMVAAFDCDLAGSVKTSVLAKAHPDCFIQGGIQEHHTATAAGALSAAGVLTFFADFGVFGIDETFNQQRLNDINRANLKLALTHVGLDVGPDGKTHQCVDYIGLARSLYNFKTIVPCDANQTDRVVRYSAETKGNMLIAMGRNRWPVLYSEEGVPCFGDGYVFEYGRMNIMRKGKDGVILTYGGMVTKGLSICDKLKERDLSFGVINMPCVNEIDEDVMEGVIGIPLIVTYEDHNRQTGIAPVVMRHLLKKGFTGRFESFGTTRYGASGETDEVLADQGLDVESMTSALLTMVRGRKAVDSLTS